MERHRKIRTADARNHFADIINSCAYGRERIILTRRNKGLVGVVPIEDIEALELIEDYLDLSSALEALKRAEEKGEKPLLWENVAKILGL